MLQTTDCKFGNERCGKIRHDVFQPSNTVEQNVRRKVMEKDS